MGNAVLDNRIILKTISVLNFNIRLIYQTTGKIQNDISPAVFPINHYLPPCISKHISVFLYFEQDPKFIQENNILR